MEKVIYLAWGDPSPLAGEARREALLGQVAPRLLASGVKGLTINVHDGQADQAPSPAPPPAGEEPHVVQVSVWLDSYEKRSGVDEALAPLGLVWGAYLVVESLYDDYGTTPHAPARRWADGQRSPGVLTVALIHRPDGLDYRQWISRWHGTQSPVSAELQPRTRYVRNEVVRSLSEGAPDIDGIVEEGWPSAVHVADPLLFFNATTQAELDANLSRMMASVGSCLDLTRLRSTTMSEYLIKSMG
jgi:hypothetical protein